MRSRIVLVLLVVALALVAVPTASPFSEGHSNQSAVENCLANIAKQTDKGVSAGGGKKEGIPAPTNCDHFYSG